MQLSLHALPFGASNSTRKPVPVRGRLSPFSQIHAIFTTNKTRLCRLNVSAAANPKPECAPWVDSEEEGNIHPLNAELTRVQAVCQQLLALAKTDDKIAFLRNMGSVSSFLSKNKDMAEAIDMLRDPQDQYLLLCLPAIGQSHVLISPPGGTPSSLRQGLEKLLETLRRVEVFYNSLGGLIGYQEKSLSLVTASLLNSKAEKDSSSTETSVRYMVPKPVDLAAEDGREVARDATRSGLHAMPSLAEIYPVGGAGDRLGLVDEVTGECLPAAMLPYCGRTMLEGLLRDLQAREYLYYRLTGRQLTTPVAIMTSNAKGNDRRIRALMKALGWHGRGEDSFRLFKQPLVPVISLEEQDPGRWLLSSHLTPMTKPGGHGAIWKLLKDEGIFRWFDEEHGRKAALVRQISNPMAGMDTTLLSLAGVGASRNASFGFMSCDRHVGAAEGVNVLQEKKEWRDGGWTYEVGITNIEYTEFDRLGITDQPISVPNAPAGSKQVSAFPANTNVLYIGLKAAESVVEQAVAEGSGEKLMPGLIFNLNKKVAYSDPTFVGSNREEAEPRSVRAGRMECTMQNMADFMTDTLSSPVSSADEASSTFLVYNHRRKVTSSAKKKREPGSTKISQSPDGSFYDLQRNAWHLLQQCGLHGLPELGSVEQYLEKGPGFIFLFNPALGPLWDVISQKIRGGSLGQGSELVLEVAEARLHEVSVEGSLVIRAEQVVGHVLQKSNGATSSLPSVDSSSSSSSSSSSAQRAAEDASSVMTIHGLQYGEEGIDISLKGLLWGSSPSTISTSSSFFSSSSSPLSSFQAIEAYKPPVLDEDHRRVFSSKCGRVNLCNVWVRNAGIDWSAEDNQYWRHKVKRKESMQVILQGQSEFEARDVVITGDCAFIVPDGYRMIVSQGPFGTIVTDLTPLLRGAQPSWEWSYSMGKEGAVELSFVQNWTPSSLDLGEDDLDSVMTMLRMGAWF